MQSSTSRVSSGLVILALLAALIAVIVFTLGSKPAAITLPAATPLPTPTLSVAPTQPATATPALGSAVRVAAGGYSLRPPAGYAIEVQGDTLLASQPGAVDGIRLQARGGSAGSTAGGTDGLSQAFRRYAMQVASANQVSVGGARSVTVAGVPAQEAAITGGAGGQAGRIVVLQPAANQFATLVGLAPAAAWQLTGQAAFEQMLASLRFFAPVAPTEAAAVQPTAAQTPAAGSTAASQPASGPAALAPPLPARTPVTVSVLAQSVLTGSAPLTGTAGVSLTMAATATTDLTSTLAPSVVPLRGELTPFTDANMADGAAVVTNTTWIATGGGALAWSAGSATPVKITSAQGPSSNRLTAVVDCPLPGLGLVFGSDRGLQVVDPSSGAWRTLDSSNSGMSYNDVSTLACSAADRYLVVGYGQHGIDIFDAARNQWTHRDRNSGLGANDVRRLAVVDNLKAIWVLSADGITVSAGQNSALINADNSPLASNRIGSLAAGSDGAVWIGGDGALYRVANNAWTTYDAARVKGDFPTKLITGLAVAPDGAIWLGSADAEICRFVPSEGRCAQFYRQAPGMAGGPLTNLTVDSSGQVIYTTGGSGISTFDGKRWRSLAKADEVLRGNRVRAIAAGAGGDLWVATDQGVQRFSQLDKPGQLFNILNSGIDVQEVRTLQPGAKGGMWVGGRGAKFYDGARWQSYAAADGLPGDYVQAIAVDGQGRTWLGTERGLSIWNGTSFFNIGSDQGIPNVDIRALQPDGSAMWIGSAGGGLYRFENNQLQVFNQANVGLPSDTVTALVLTPDGALLIGTDRGLAELKAGALARVDVLGARPITSLAYYGDRVWAGTANDGLYDGADGRWQQVKAGSGLPSNSISDLAVGQGALWIGGRDGGLVRYKE